MTSEMEKTMLKPVIVALNRQTLTVTGIALVAEGYVQATDIEPVIGALLTIGPLVWSGRSKSGGERFLSQRAGSGY